MDGQGCYIIADPTGGCDNPARDSDFRTTLFSSRAAGSSIRVESHGYAFKRSNDDPGAQEGILPDSLRATLDKLDRSEPAKGARIAPDVGSFSTAFSVTVAERAEKV